MKDHASVDSSLSGAPLSVAALNGEAALNFFPDPALTKRTFDLYLGPEIKSQDLYTLGGTVVNEETQAAAWALTKSRFPEILAKVDASLGGGLAQLAGSFCDAKLRDDAQEFFAAQNLPGAARLLQNAKDQVNDCIELRALQQANLSVYLKK
jgi:hypothetical protein